MNTGLNGLAWREVLERVLGQFESQENVKPEWLINPGTGRRLKLDLLYPEVGIAIRFTGLQGKRKRRRSDWEQLEEEQREQNRAELCRLNGVALVVINLTAPEPRRVLNELEQALSAASRRVATGTLPKRQKAALMEKLDASRRTLAQLRSQLKQPEDLALFAELWRDRETAAVTAAQAAAQADQSTAGRLSPRKYREGMRVRHLVFGLGVVERIHPNDARVTVLFADGVQRTFLASLVANKLLPE